MKISTLTAAWVVLIAHTAAARASGCMWYDEYTLGKLLMTREIAGIFNCQPVTHSTIHQCWFTPSDQTVGQFTSSDFVFGESLPTDHPVSVTIQSYEAMHWNNCDGGDQTPPFVKNGTYAFFDFSNSRYQRFVADPALAALVQPHAPGQLRPDRATISSLYMRSRLDMNQTGW